MNRLLLAFILFISNMAAFAQDDRAVLAVLENQVVDWNRGDIDSFVDAYWRSDSLMFVGKKGPVYGFNNMLQRYKKAYPDKAAMGKLKYNILKIAPVNPTNVLLMGRWELTRQSDNPGGYFTLWMRELEGIWKIASDHTSD